ncbi:MAG: tyrosine-type recombinase/integrase [Psychrobium sp.]
MFTKPDNLSFAVCVPYYLKYCRAKEQSETTVIAKEDALRYFRRWCNRNKIFTVDKVDNELLEGYQEYLNEYRKVRNGESLSKGTKRYRLTAVKTFIRKLHLKGVIPVNQTERFELPKLGRRLPKPILSIREVDKVIEQAALYGNKGLRDKAIMATYYASGIRRTELSELTVDDIDFEQYQLRVNRGKGDKDRYVPISKSACFTIYHYLKTVRPLFEKSHSGISLFIANNGKPYRPAQLSELVAKYIKLSDVRKSGACNQYRHAAATHMVDNGADIRHVQEFLGHADISTTQIYVHVSMVKLREVYNRTHPSALH